MNHDEGFVRVMKIKWFALMEVDGKTIKEDGCQFIKVEETDLNLKKDWESFGRSLHGLLLDIYPKMTRTNILLLDAYTDEALQISNFNFKPPSIH